MELRLQMGVKIYATDLVDKESPSEPVHSNVVLKCCVSVSSAIEVVSLTCRLPETPRRFIVLISVRGRVNPRATVQLKGLGQLKNLMMSTNQLTTVCSIDHIVILVWSNGGVIDGWEAWKSLRRKTCSSAVSPLVLTRSHLGPNRS
jgi:hypothetical protein